MGIPIPEQCLLHSTGATSKYILNKMDDRLQPCPKVTEIALVNFFLDVISGILLIYISFTISSR